MNYFVEGGGVTGKFGDMEYPPNERWVLLLKMGCLKMRLSLLGRLKIVLKSSNLIKQNLHKIQLLETQLLQLD